MLTPLLGSLLVALSPSAADDRANDLAPPVRLQAAGKPIDTEIGHAHPYVVDWDGDGVKDLLVGQFGQGLLWIYRNEGSNESPRLAAGVKFQDGAETGRVPTG
jgi:hypothetical protein